MADRVISWAEYHQSIERLAQQIYESEWEFTQILCLAKGGLRIGDILARIFARPLAILNVSSYGGIGNRTQGKILFGDYLTNFGELGDRLLLVDDLADTGESLEQTLGWLKFHAPHLQEIRTAVLWYKGNSSFQPNYYVEYLPGNPWIQQPFEHYEQYQFFPIE